MQKTGSEKKRADLNNNRIPVSVTISPDILEGPESPWDDAADWNALVKCGST